MFHRCVVALLFSITLPCAVDWPNQRGPTLDGAIPAGSVLPTTLPDAPKVLWKGPVTDGFAAPIVVAGKVVYLDLQNGQETVHCLTFDKAKPLWDAPLDIAHKDGFGTGPRCAPVSDGKLVFAQSCKGQLTCFALDSGKVVWSTNYVKDFGAIYIGEKGDAKGGSRHGYNGSPTLDGDRLYALASGPGAGVVCFDKSTGKVIWKSQDDQAAYSPPEVATIAGVKQVVCFTVLGALGVAAADGALLWRVPLTTNYGRHVMAPIVHGDLVIVGSHEVGLVA
ncbi:MAG TPA: PQQ-binding-like beta-propeller repeat protein, partial [Planctomycetota bacterium]|nr:PQQ-binding-like beta-propeller repeat protein [Planctomycetota bacterium]